MAKKELRSSILQYDASDDTSYLTHAIFRWYGKLVPPLVSDVLDMYCEPGDTIFANFNGSGTIALEGMIRNEQVIGTDINPLAILVSKVKTTKLPNIDINAELETIICNAIKQKINQSEIDSLYDADKWYSGDAIYDLLKLKKSIIKIQNNDVKDFFMVCLLGIVRDCSNIDSRCVNHIVVDRKRPIPDVFAKFKKEVISNYTAIKTLDSHEILKPEFHLCDCRKASFIKDESVDLVFSHPPYLNAINYYNIHRLATDLADFNYDQIRTDDFSAKKHDVFLKFMSETFAEGKRVLKPGKRMVVVIGDVRYEGNILPLGIELINSLRENDFDIEDIFIWVLTKKAGMNVARRGNHIDHNYVIVAKKRS